MPICRAVISAGFWKHDSIGSLEKLRGFLMSPKILYVDDQPIFLKIVEIHLKRAGFRDFYFTQDNSGAVEAIRREQPDLVLLDISMPGVSGLDILNEMQDDRDLRRIPVLMVTASTGERRRNALECGARAIISKPIEVEDLVSTIRDVVGRESLGVS